MPFSIPIAGRNTGRNTEPSGQNALTSFQTRLLFILIMIKIQALAA
ncbi:hypothetical protein Hneap_0522 [Halothiobacillus neapolitanus c2]|uniref:Uncharacterized protein n=1 Tax=Halothiobacillus neapolitanus (strain ATCC 23641 / DSM 15147 / CIP 104769 / NCIMB 8539 / c2) TaxID=555778 RepID=D0KY53_HALNC|nr:hypothetical protein Hneap_0522 [Halothiobacillus neapolitanus c2]TDN58363.1 hypothetical protein C8D83_10745 [Halothiobacillus neapolitanus]